MWYIFLRDYSDTELLTSPKYNDEIKNLINRVSYMQVDFAFYLDTNFYNESNRFITPINEFIQDKKSMYFHGEEELKWLEQLEQEVKS